MLSDISGRLAQAIDLKRRKEKLERDLARLDARLAERSARAVELDQQLKKEQVDVERLEGLSIAGLFYSVLGSKEEQVDKERQELLAAQLKYQQARHEVEAMRAEKESLERELRALSGVDREYAALLAEKEDALRRGDPKTASELLRLTEQIAHLSAHRREVEEAEAAAGEVITALDGVIESLESAEGWGTWDLLGGGFLVTAAKHSRIDEARTGVQIVQAKLNRFQRELADVRQSADIQIDIGTLEGFADFFFDGLLMDWIVQSKIAQSLERARQARARAGQAQTALRRAREDAVAQANLLAKQRRTIIEGA